MKKAKTRTVPYRRVREGKTNYKRRLKLLVSNIPRIVIRRSSKYIKAQLVVYSAKGDKVLFATDSKELSKAGWKAGFNNTPAAYLTGLLFAKKVGKKKVIVDIGMQTSIKGNVIYSFVKGCVDGGLDVSCSETILPSEDRISGKHIADYAKSLKQNKEKFEKQFGKLSKVLDPEKIVEHFKEVKQKILGK